MLACECWKNEVYYAAVLAADVWLTFVQLYLLMDEVVMKDKVVCFTSAELVLHWHSAQTESRSV